MANTGAKPGFYEETLMSELEDEQGAELLRKFHEKNPPAKNAAEQEAKDAEFQSELLAEFDLAEKEAQVAIRDILWVTFPRSDNLNVAPAHDVKSDRAAAMIVDGLKVKNFKISRV